MRLIEHCTAMRIRHNFPIIREKRYRWFMTTINTALQFDSNDKAKFRLHVVTLLETKGWQTVKLAFPGVSRASVFRWKKRYLDQQRKLGSLVPTSTKPKRVRRRLVNHRIVEQIEQLRLRYGNLGKDKLKPLIDEYCIKEGIETTSASTIGRIISDHSYFFQKTTKMYHNPNHGFAKQIRRKRLRQRYAPKPKDFGHIEMDTLVKYVDGIKLYLITAIDVKLKYSFAQSYTKLNSSNALDCFKKFQLVHPFVIHTVQTDNGLEFLGEFNNHLEKKAIKHLFTYPRCPKINGVIERFNRTLREDFLNPNLHLIYQPQLFHRKLIDYLLFFNTRRPHQSLGQRSPMGYALEEGYLSQMYWTSTLN